MKWLLVALCAALVSPRPADACSCIPSSVEVSPPASVAAPLNTLIRVSWAADMPDMAHLAGASIELVPRGGKVAVAVDRKQWTSGNVITLILTPRQPLAAKSTYEVVLRKPKEVSVLGQVVTGTAADKDAPTWKGASEVQYVHAPAVCCNCSTGDPWVMVKFADGADAVKDDQTQRDDIAFGIWPADGKLDASRLLAVVPAWRGRLVLGDESICAPRNFDLPKAAKSLRLRIAPLDHAGNAGEPAAITIDLTKPLTQAP